MNDNPDGTPNPLNPAPMEPVGPEAPVGPMGPEQPEQVPPAMPEQTAPVENAAPEMVETVVTETMVTEPEPKDSIVEPKQKSSKKPVIIIAIVLLLVAIGCGVAAILLLNPFGGKKDAVPAAISKLISTPPTNVTASGTVTINSAATTSVGATPIESLEVDFTSNINAKTNENATNMTLSITPTDGEELSFDINEVYTKDKNLYLKVSGIKELFYPNATDCEDGDVDCETNVDEEKCIDDETGEMKCGGIDSDVATSDILTYLAFLSIIDDEWIKISSDTIESLAGITEVDAPTQCLIDATGKLGEYSDNVINIYNENPFVEYSTDNLTVTKKKDPIYRLTFNGEKLAGFINSMSNSGFVNELYACMGTEATNQTVTESDLTEIMNYLPETYVEIDGDNNFTRVYITAKNQNGEGAGTADISFSYPTNSVVIEEPADALDFNTLLMQIFNNQEESSNVPVYNY